MAWKIAEAFVQLKADGMGQVSSAIAGVKTQLGSLGGGNIAGAFDSTIGRMRGSIGGLASAATSLQGVLAGASIVATGKHMVSLAMDTEQATVAFKVMLGSMEDAKRLMGEVAAFAAETPFEMPEVVNATRSLIAFGSSSKTVIEEVRRLGDIASGVSMPINELAQIYGKARVQGRLFAEDINQLTGRGIPIIQELSKQLGIADSEVKKAVESGAVGFGNIEAAFKSLTDQGGRFSGMMKEQSQTMAGIASTAKDDLNAALRDTGEIIGKAIIPKIAEMAKGLKEASEIVIGPKEGAAPPPATDAGAEEAAGKAYSHANNATPAEAQRMLREMQKLRYAKGQELSEREMAFGNRNMANPLDAIQAPFDLVKIDRGKAAVMALDNAIRALRRRLNQAGGAGKSTLEKEVTQAAVKATAAVSNLGNQVNRAMAALKITPRQAISAMIGPLKDVKRGDFGFDEKKADAAIARATAKYQQRMAEINNMKGDAVSTSTIAKETADAKAELQKATDAANAAQTRSFAGLIEQAKKEFEQHKQMMARFYNRGPTAAATSEYQQRIKELEAQQARAQEAAKKTPQFMSAGAMAKAWWAGQQELIRQSNELHAKGNKLWEESKTPMDRYLDRLKEINELRAKGHISEETYNRAKRKADKEIDQSLGNPEMEFRTKAGQLAKAKHDAAEQERQLAASRQRGEINDDQLAAGRQRIRAALEAKQTDIQERHPEPKIQSHGLEDFYKHIQSNLTGKDRAREEREKKQVAALEKIAANTAPEKNKQIDVARWEE